MMKKLYNIEIKKLCVFFLLFFCAQTYSQSKMRTIEELINVNNPIWPEVLNWIKTAKNGVEVLSVDKEKNKEILYKTQVSIGSPMGAIVYETGGILIDNGWIRILGSGNNKLKRTLPEWNLKKGFSEYGQSSKFLLIADDALGGFFMLNGGGLGSDLGKVYYFAPDTLQFEPLNLTYSEFLYFCLNNNLETFYKDQRWKTWKEDLLKLDGDKVFNFYPYLFTEEGKDIEKVSKKIIPIEEQYDFNLHFRKELGLE